MKRYRTTGDGTIALESAADPEPGHGEVRVDLRAASLNFRDLIVAQRFPGVVPASDGAGVVSAVGPGAAGVSVGDRVVIGFMPGWAEGEYSEAKKASSLGGPGVDGVLAERIVVPATGVVRLPDAMSFTDAATLPCAGVTAWSALLGGRCSPARPCCCSAPAACRSSRCSSPRWRARA